MLNTCHCMRLSFSHTQHKWTLLRQDHLTARQEIWITFVQDFDLRNTLLWNTTCCQATFPAAIIGLIILIIQNICCSASLNCYLPCCIKKLKLELVDIALSKTKMTTQLRLKEGHSNTPKVRLHYCHPGHRYLADEQTHLANPQFMVIYTRHHRWN